MTKLTRALERLFFDMVFLCYALVAFPLFVAKGKLKEGWSERWGRVGTLVRERLAGKSVVWIHSVSVGETRLACHLLSRLRHRMPGTAFVLSTTTTSARKIARDALAPEDTLLYFPFDFSFAVRRWLDAVAPRLVVIFETEIWPNLLGELRARRVPVIIANARISNASFGRYLKIAPFLRRELKEIALCLAQSAAHGERFTRLGLPADRMKVSGNMKFDLQTAQAGSRADLRRVFEELKAEQDAAVFLASSTHPGEEELLLAVYLQLKGVFPNLRLVIAPRHIERLGSIEALIGRKNLSSARLSSLLKAKQRSLSEILLVDVWGILHEIYPYADVVFVGGSLVPSGGHNIAEPASSGRAVLHGPHMANFSDMAEEFRKSGGVIEASGAEDLASKLMGLLRDPGERERLGSRAREVVLRNSGATDRVAEEIVQRIERKGVLC